MSDDVWLKWRVNPGLFHWDFLRKTSIPTVWKDLPNAEGSPIGGWAIFGVFVEKRTAGARREVRKGKKGGRGPVIGVCRDAKEERETEKGARRVVARAKPREQHSSHWTDVRAAGREIVSRRSPLWCVYICWFQLAVSDRDPGTGCNRNVSAWRSISEVCSDLLSRIMWWPNQRRTVTSYVHLVRSFASILRPGSTSQPNYHTQRRFSPSSSDHADFLLFLSIQTRRFGSVVFPYLGAIDDWWNGRVFLLVLF